MNGTNLFIEQLASCSKHLRHLVVHADHDSTTKKKGWTNGVLLEYEDGEQIDAITIAVKPGIIPQGAGAYYGKLRCGLDIYHVLLVSGYEEQEGPGECSVLAV